MLKGFDILSGTSEVRKFLRERKLFDAGSDQPEHPGLLKTVYGMVLDARVAMYIAWGPELRMFYNDAYVAVLGRKHPNALGRPLWEVWPELKEQFLPIINTALSGTPSYFENTELILYRHGHTETAWFTLSISPIHAETGDVLGVWVTVLETTEQVLVERQRTSELEFLRHLFQEAPGFIAILHGENHIFTLANKAFKRLVGDRDVLGMSYRTVLPELEGQGYYELLDQVYSTGAPYVANGVLVRLRNKPEGTLDEVFVNFVFQPIFDGNGDISGIFIEGSDVTKQYRAQQDLERKIQDLNDTDKRKDEFLAMLAHELRNPLAPISAAAELLQRARLDEARVRQTSQIIARQVSHMTSLVDDLLDVSRVTRGAVELDQTPQDIGQLIAEAIEQVNPLIRSRQHLLSLQLAADACTVVGDRKRLVQVIANILNNAAKYTNEGGKILLRTEVQGEHILVEITDNGIGMTPELAAHAFDLFVQAERTSDRLLGGLGLGLALVKKLVELHHGTVRCSSEGPGKGSTFTVCLPRYLLRENDADTQGLIDVRQAKTHALRILIVDDNVDAASILAMLLEASGHDVFVEYGSRMALARAQSEAPQVCLLDIGLPEIDGNELARRLRSQPETADSLLIAITGYGQESDREQTRLAGFDHHLVKPVDIKVLEAIFRSHEGS